MKANGIIKSLTLHVELTQQIRGIHPLLFQCWAIGKDDGPTLKQHWVNAACLLRNNLWLALVAWSQKPEAWAQCDMNEMENFHWIKIIKYI